MTRACGTDWAKGIQARCEALPDDGSADGRFQEALVRLGNDGIVVQIARNHLLYGEWLRGTDQLAADGKTNPQIGTELFLSSRTVEWHLRKVYSKLGIRSRRDPSAALADVEASGVQKTPGRAIQPAARTSDLGDS